MARPEVTGRRKAGVSATATPVSARGPPAQQPSEPAAPDVAGSSTIGEFCFRNRISVQLFYKRPDLMPDTFYVGSRRLVGNEAETRWRTKREAAARRAKREAAARESVALADE